MTQLLAIETAFLSKAEIKQALNLTEVRNLQRTLTNGQKKKFELTLQLSKVVGASVTWFKSEEGKAKCNEEGIKWSTEEFGNKVFGWQKSYFYKVIKASGLEAELVETFKAKCDEVEAEGKDANRTLEGLLKFAKQTSEGGATGEGEGEGEGEANVERAETVFTMTYKTSEGNVSVRIDSNNVIKTTNSIAEIEAAIKFLSSQLPR